MLIKSWYKSVTAIYEFSSGGMQNWAIKISIFNMKYNIWKDLLQTYARCSDHSAVLLYETCKVTLDHKTSLK